jgi:hypothetical protein
MQIDYIIFVPSGETNGSLFSDILPKNISEVLWLHPIGMSSHAISDTIQSKSSMVDLQKATGILPFSLLPDPRNDRH